MNPDNSPRIEQRSNTNNHSYRIRIRHIYITKDSEDFLEDGPPSKQAIYIKKSQRERRNIRKPKLLLHSLYPMTT